MRSLLVVPATLMALAVGACGAAVVPTDRVERARGQVQAATADPAVQRFARPELESAQDAFANAERSVRRKLDAQVIEHWAYLAEQRAAIARETARLRRAEAEIRAAEIERSQPPLAAAPAAPPSVSGAADASAMTRAAATLDARAALTLGDDQFVADGFALKPDAATELDGIARMLQDDPVRMVRVDGHSDDVNSRSRSLEFSGRRAEAVRSELVRRGIDPRRIAVRALGDAFPVASNETALGRQRNRRVDVYIVTDGAAARSAP